MAETRKVRKPSKKNHQNYTLPQKKAERTSTWGGLRALFSCKPHHSEEVRKRCGIFGCSVSLCNLKESSKVMHRLEVSCPVDHKKLASVDCPADHKKLVSVVGFNGSIRSTKTRQSDIDGSLSSSFSSSYSASTATATSSSSSSLGGSFRGMHLRRFSGCYECHSVVNPINGVSRFPSVRVSVCTCPDCGEIFTKSDSLELHQALCHAVSKLGREDTSRNIVEIIFQSSWLKKQSPPCKIDRILKISNTRKTIAKFEDYKDYIKTRAGRLTKKYPRCTADGNELLRFHCTNFTCSIGSNGSTSLCHSIPQCTACSIIRDGFKLDGTGRIRTMATSGRAHDTARIPSNSEKRAMLVCRVIAGRVKKEQDFDEEYDSVTGPAGIYSNLDELFVFNPKAILPCFLVIYRGF